MTSPAQWRCSLDRSVGRSSFFGKKNWRPNEEQRSSGQKKATHWFEDYSGAGLFAIALSGFRATLLASFPGAALRSPWRARIPFSRRRVRCPTRAELGASCVNLKMGTGLLQPRRGQRITAAREIGARPVDQRTALPTERSSEAPQGRMVQSLRMSWQLWRHEAWPGVPP